MSKTASFRDYRLEGIAVATDGPLAVVFDWGLKLYTPPDWRMRSELEPDCEVDSVELSRNRQLLAAYVRGCWEPSQKAWDPASDQVIRVWDPATWTVRYTVPMEPQDALKTGLEFYEEHKPEAMAFSPDGAYLAVATRESTTILDARTGQLLKTLSILRGGAPAIAITGPKKMKFSPDGSLLAEYDGRIMLWQVAGWKPQPDISTADHVIAISFSRDGKWLAAAAKKKIDLWQRMP